MKEGKRKGGRERRKKKEKKKPLHQKTTQDQINIANHTEAEILYAGKMTIPEEDAHLVTGKEQRVLLIRAQDHAKRHLHNSVTTDRSGFISVAR